MITTLVKSHILFLLLQGSISFLNAQTQAIATYAYESYGGYKTELTLRIDGDQSHFIYQKEDTTITNEKGWEYYHQFEHYEFFLDLGDQTIVEQRLPNDVIPLISRWKTDLKWEILDETKEIAGYAVQKATTKAYPISEGAKGTMLEYVVAWFTMDIPFSTGPARYYGLPGLIIHLELSNRNEINYTLKDISFETVGEIVPPREGIEVSKAEIIRPFLINKKWLKQQKKAYKAQMENE